MRMKLFLLCFCFGSIVSFLGYVAYHQLYLRGMQGEAKLMMSYLHTLQRVYRLEHGSFVSFDNYGAPLRGRDNCAQPLEAARLGFLLPGCHRKGTEPPRYAYRSFFSEKGERYILQAESGSDAQKRSLVCFDKDGLDLWESRQGLDFSPLKSCW